MSEDRSSMSGFVEESVFPFAAEFRKNWERIRDELRKLSQEVFKPYWNHAIIDGRWDVTPLIWRGEEYDLPTEPDVRFLPNTTLCPFKTELLLKIPTFQCAGFSLLGAGSNITPYTDDFGYDVIRGHLGLEVPPRCDLHLDGMIYPQKAGV